MELSTSALAVHSSGSGGSRCPDIGTMLFGVMPPRNLPRQLRGRPFRGSAAVAAGWLTRGQLRNPAWRRVFHDVYVQAAMPDSHLLRIRAASLILPTGARIGGRSAAHLWGCDLATTDDPVEILVPGRFHPRPGIDIRQGRLAPTDGTTINGIPVGTPLFTAWDLARSRPMTDAIGWLDALARCRALSPAEMREFVERHRGERHFRRAQETTRQCDPRSESVPESKLRVGLVTRGLLGPVPQFVVRDIAGRFLARVDLAWPQWKFAIEYDGAWHADQLTADRRRIRALNAAGWYVYPVTAPDLSDMDTLVHDLQIALAAWRSR